MLLLLTAGCGKETEPVSSFDERFSDMYLSTDSESNERAAALLPTAGSEDATFVLGAIPLELNETAKEDNQEYAPAPQNEWVVSVSFEWDTTLSAQNVAALFGKDWRERFGGLTIYGKSAETGLWTFLISSDGPQGVTALQFAWPYYANWAETPGVTSSQMFAERIRAVRDKISSLAPQCQVEPSMDPKEAEERSRFLSTIGDRFGLDVTLRVQAPTGKSFNGREIWDVMLCLGLHWGDMDCFHWRNESGLGDDYFFSVWTSTPPGYFLPEQIASDSVNVSDLVFSFSLPRCAAPEQVFDSMYAATQYVQKRLGGTITDGSGNPISDVQQHKAEIERRTRELNALGFNPGSDAALRFF